MTLSPIKIVKHVTDKFLIEIKQIISMFRLVFVCVLLKDSLTYK